MIRVFVGCCRRILLAFFLVFWAVPGMAQETLSGGQVDVLPGDGPSAKVAAPDSFWQVVAIDGKEIVLQPGERRPNMLLAEGNTKVSGFSGCNRFFGGVVAEGDSFRFTRQGMTRMACMGKADDLETKFIAALYDTVARRVNGSTMELVDKDGVVRMRLEAGRPE